jgi:hypothetical protein
MKISKFVFFLILSLMLLISSGSPLAYANDASPERAAAPSNIGNAIYLAVGPTITNYNLPCRYNTKVYLTTFHSTDRDGNGQVDLKRRSYDITCDRSLVFAPAQGRVYSTKSSGMLFIDDASNNACMVFLHITGVAVGQGMTVSKGTFLGIGNGAGGHVHVAATNGLCKQLGSQPGPAEYEKAEERDIKWIEVGKVLPPDLGTARIQTYISRNPGDIFQNGNSNLKITCKTVELKVCASNLWEGRKVYVSVWRNANNSPLSITGSAQAHNKCVSLSFHDKRFATIPAGVKYYTVASIAPAPADLASLRRESCGSATGGAELCDAKSR